MAIVPTSQLKIPCPVEPPVVQLAFLWRLRSEEDEISEQTSRSAIPVYKRVNPDCLCVNCDSQLTRCPILGVLPAIEQGAKGVAKFNSDRLGGDTNIRFYPPVDAGPRPDLSVDLTMKSADEVIVEQFIKKQPIFQHCNEVLLFDLCLYRLLEIVDGSFGYGDTEQRPGSWQ